MAVGNGIVDSSISGLMEALVEYTGKYKERNSFNNK